MNDDERRRVPRHQFEARGWVTWQGDDGKRRQARGYCLNISDAGLRIEIREHLPVGMDLNVGYTGAGSRPAKVIYCERRGSRFMIGLEFTGEVVQAASS